MARPVGYPGGRGPGTGAKTNKSCIVVKVWTAKKWSFVARAMRSPAYGLRAWQHYCAVPVA